MTVDVIAEFCQNHNGDTALLSEMLHAASENGARVAKIQTIFANNLTYRPKFETGVEVDGKVNVIKRPYQPEYERLKGLELDFDAHARFVEMCDGYGLTPMTTCFTREHIRQIKNAGFRQVKVASYDCASYQLLRELKAAFEYLLVSTGATFDDEIETAARLLNGHPYALLHCVTIYPTPLEKANAARIEYLKKLTPNVGFSDHSHVEKHGTTASKVAIYMGATTIERHFTVLAPTETKDGPVSIGPEQLNELVRFGGLDRGEQLQELDDSVPGWRACVGEKKRLLSHEELLNRDYYRGRFASRRRDYGKSRMVYNWEETLLDYE